MKARLWVHEAISVGVVSAVTFSAILARAKFFSLFLWNLVVFLASILSLPSTCISVKIKKEQDGFGQDRPNCRTRKPSKRPINIPELPPSFARTPQTKEQRSAYRGVLSVRRFRPLLSLEVSFWSVIFAEYYFSIVRTILLELKTVRKSHPIGFRKFSFFGSHRFPVWRPYWCFQLWSHHIIRHHVTISARTRSSKLITGSYKLVRSKSARKQAIRCPFHWLSLIVCLVFSAKR